MSRQLISRNKDLLRLRDEGYEVEIRSNLLFVHSVPYVNAKREIAFGTIVSELTLNMGVTQRPASHQVYFIGDHPCNADGSVLTQIGDGAGRHPLAEGVIAQYHFSNKPRRGHYEDYYEKITTYVLVISSQAKAINATVDARTFKVIDTEEQSVFLYEDTASSRAGIHGLTAKFKPLKIAIVGLGGTGSYVLDLVSKTHVAEIHLYDGDDFLQHNAFRAPGAASRSQLEKRMSKVGFFSEVYGALRTGIFAHHTMVDEGNVSELSNYDYVFICIDKGHVRGLIADTLKPTNTTFIDVGMGVNVAEQGDALWGSCRATASTADTREIAAASLPIADRDEELYRANIQIADLNCINAAMAVIKWKRMVGFYVDDRNEYESIFSVSLNQISNKDVLSED